MAENTRRLFIGRGPLLDILYSARPSMYDAPMSIEELMPVLNPAPEPAAIKIFVDRRGGTKGNGVVRARDHKKSSK